MNNVFNVKYYNHLSRIKDIMPEPGRSLSLQYELDFEDNWISVELVGLDQLGKELPTHN